MELSERLHELSLSDDDLILKFDAKVMAIEAIDLIFIKLIKALSREGHLSEKQKRILLNQLILVLRKLESLEFQEKEELKEIKAEIDSFLKLELTVERIGIEVTDYLYHGGGISGISSFRPDTIDFETPKTLDIGLYLTGNRRMAINYANYRYWSIVNNEELRRKFEKRIKRSLYKLRIKKNKNYIADLNDPIKLRSICKDLKDYCERTDPHETLPDQIKSFRRAQLIGFSKYLEFILANNIMFNDIRFLLMGHSSYVPPSSIEYKLRNFESAIVYVTKFLQDLGFHGLRCSEAGEQEQSIYDWEPSVSYVMFNPDDVEIVSEEHFDLRNGKVIRVK